VSWKKTKSGSCFVGSRSATASPALDYIADGIVDVAVDVAVDVPVGVVEDLPPA
jgi:hypothetical protein